MCVCTLRLPIIVQGELRTSTVQGGPGSPDPGFCGPPGGGFSGDENTGKPALLRRLKIHGCPKHVQEHLKRPQEEFKNLLETTETTPRSPKTGISSRKVSKSVRN